MYRFVLQVEVAITLGKIVLNNSQTQKLLVEQTKFRVVELLHHLSNKEETVRLKAGMALATFAYNNTPQQYAVKNRRPWNLFDSLRRVPGV